MFQNSKKTFVFILTGIFLYSCQKESEVLDNIPKQVSSSEENSVVLGKKLENPYSVENMKKALQNLKNSSTTARNAEAIEIKPTHLYIRFLPKTEEELSIIKADSMLILYEYPLDYEIVKNGSYYREPNLPENQPTPRYCAVEVGTKFPEGVEYELLSELFIPDEEKIDPKGHTKRPIIASDFAEILVDEALRLTNNEDEVTPKSNPTALFPSKWRPSGRIRVWDDNFEQFVGVRGLKVQARRWFTTHTGFVGDDGSFVCDGTFRRPANYTACFERYEFEIRDGWLSTALLDGPKVKGSWDVDMRGDKYEFYATIFRAAHHYYYEDIKGLRRPPENGFWKTQMKLRAFMSSDANSNFSAARRFLGLGSAIQIYNPHFSSMTIYATVIHELAHAAHWNMDSSAFRKLGSPSIIKESWARGVQWELTRMVYPDYRGGGTLRPNYTQLVVDMIDAPFDINQGVGFPIDNVQGYTIRQIEDALKGQTSWEGWRDNIIRMYNNETENNLPALFEHWRSN